MGRWIRESSSKILIKDGNEVSDLYLYENQFVEDQTFTFSIEYDYMTFENFTNVYESTLTIIWWMMRQYIGNKY